MVVIISIRVGVRIRTVRLININVGEKQIGRVEVNGLRKGVAGK